MPPPRPLHRVAPRALSLAMVAIGLVLIALTLARGGGPLAVGVVVGVLFVAAGSARLYLQPRPPGGCPAPGRGGWGGGACSAPPGGPACTSKPVPPVADRAPGGRLTRAASGSLPA